MTNGSVQSQEVDLKLLPAKYLAIGKGMEIVRIASGGSCFYVQLVRLPEVIGIGNSEREALQDCQVKLKDWLGI